MRKNYKVIFEDNILAERMELSGNNLVRAVLELLYQKDLMHELEQEIQRSSRLTIQ